ncbi:MAG: ABC transporter ATP-binding protein [Anaerolineae bacterium]
MAGDYVIETQGLTQRYGKFVAVKDVNLAVYRGEIFGFLGPNGAGKTSTIRTMLDFLRPANGHVKVFGLDSKDDSVEIRRRVGYLPSELTLWENWSGIEYVRWLEQVRGVRLEHEAKRLADALEFDLFRQLRGLSTGMKRKMGIIAALAHKPELLILDEPTNGLDPLMQKVFHELMLETRQEGRTVFLSSHILTEVEQICDRVGIIRQGQLQAIETVQSLTASTFRWLTLKVNGAPQANGFAQLEGISEICAANGSLRMKITGEADMNAVLRQATQYDVQDLQLEKPTLEEIFLAFYGEKEVRS